MTAVRFPIKVHYTLNIQNPPVIPGEPPNPSEMEDLGRLGFYLTAPKFCWAIVGVDFRYDSVANSSHLRRAWGKRYTNFAKHKILTIALPIVNLPSPSHKKDRLTRTEDLQANDDSSGRSSSCMRLTTGLPFKKIVDCISHYIHEIYSKSLTSKQIATHPRQTPWPLMKGIPYISCW